MDEKILSGAMLRNTTLFEPRQAKTCLRAYADSKGPNQPAHPHSLITAFTVRLQNRRIL